MSRERRWGVDYILEAIAITEDDLYITDTFPAFLSIRK